MATKRKQCAYTREFNRIQKYLKIHGGTWDCRIKQNGDTHLVVFKGTRIISRKIFDKNLDPKS